MVPSQFVKQLIPKISDYMNQRIKDFDTSFYKKCIEWLETENEKEYNVYFFEPLRLFLVNNFDDYFCYLSENHNDNDNVIRREIEITDHGRINLLKQFNAIELNNINALITNEYPDLKSIILIVSPTELSDPGNSMIRIRSKDSLGLFLGHEILRIAEHQDMDRFVGYMINKRQKKMIRESNQMFGEMYGMYKSLDQNVKDRSLFFSGFCLHALGTTYTEDADMIYWAKNQNEKDIKKAESIFSRYQKLEYFIHTEKRNDIDMTGDVLTNPEKHFYFMGMKIVGINIHLHRLYYRASAPAFVDMYMLNRINKFNVKPCFPLMTLRDDPPIIFTQQVIDNKLRTVRRYLKEWHGIKVSKKEVSELIKKCNNYPYDPPFQNKFNLNENIRHIETVYQVTTLTVMSKLFDKDENLLVIDDVSEPYDYGSKIKKHETKIVIIGSDKDRIEQLKKKNVYSNQIFINKNISDEWIYDESDILYKTGKYKNILIQYNTNQIFKNKQNFIKNIQSVDDIDTTIIVTYLDGKMIRNKMNETNIYQIKDHTDTIIFGIYEYDKINNTDGVVVFLRDSDRYHGGIAEMILTLDDIREIFESMNYSMIREGTLDSDNEADLMQKSISEIFRYVVFKKNLKTQ